VDASWSCGSVRHAREAYASREQLFYGRESVFSSRCRGLRSKRLTAGFLLVMFAVVLVVEPLPVHAASSLVQQNGVFCAPAGGAIRCGSTLSVPFSSNVASGNVVVAAIASGDAAWNPPATVTSVGDSLGSSFTQAVSASHGVEYAYIYYATLASSGPDTVTVTFSVDISDQNGMAYLYIYEVSGVKTTGVATGTGSGTIPDFSGSISTSSTAFLNGAFLVAIMANNIESSNWGAGSGFELSPPPHDPRGTVDQFVRLSKAEYSTSGVSSPTTFPATLSSTNPSQDWVEAAIALSPATILRVEDPASHLNKLDVAVGSVFSVDIWIRGIPPNDPMDSFGFDMTWDPTFIRYDHSQGNPPSDWSVTVDDANAASGTLSAGGIPLQNGNPYSGDHMWVSVYFRCLKSGVGTIEIPFATWMDDVGGFQLSFDSVLGATVSQTAGYTPPVGGELLPANKLAVFAPYLALFGLAAIIAVGFAKPCQKPDN